MNMQELDNLIESYKVGEISDEIFTTSLREFGKQCQNLKDRSVSWSVVDFESRARHIENTLGIRVYKRENFKDALGTMIRKHDCNYGITWDTIDSYLDELCKIKK